MGRRGRRIAVIAVVVIVIAGGATAAYAQMSSSAPSYRLADVTSADVTATLNEVGTLTPAQQADVAFSASGTVATVAVQPGQSVTAGQKLGTLDTTSLKASLASAQSSLASANLQVANDIASQDAAANGSGNGSGGAGSTGGSPGSSSGLASSLRPLQQAVVGGQRAVDAALAKASTDLAVARQACAATGSKPSPSPSASPSPSPSPSPTVSPSPANCASAEQRVLADETAASRAQQTLSAQLTDLSAALARDESGSSPAGGAGGSGNDPGGSSGAGGGTVSAQQLAADQASADAAADQVEIAQQNLAGATAISPISGTVVSVTATPGAAENAGSTEFEIAGLDSWQVVTQVPVTDMPQIETGESASVLADGSSVPLSGTIVTIGLMPTASSNPATYPVTIGLAGQPSGLDDGGYAGVTITTAHSSGVSVPTSAVHYSGTQATVTVYAAGQTRVIKVKVGTKGPVMTRITSGLTVGQQVVLANLSAPLPNNNPSGNQLPGGGTFNFLAPGPGGGVVHIQRAG
jgi:multidrug efflux pump subunit AcrA (membrane-fusion protein)